MNPEIRFRVPKHVLTLAQERAQQYGLTSGKGRTGGASQLARGALYTALGLSLPGDLHQLQAQSFETVRQARSGFSEKPGQMRIEVHHRVDPSFRKTKALQERKPVAARTTTVFEFEQGELPDFLVPYIVLTEDGYPYASLNLEGGLSPRRKALGELVSAQQECTLGELEACLKKLRKSEDERLKREKRLQARTEKGTQILEKWLRQHGSDLLKARHSEGFEWLQLGCDEYCLARLAHYSINEALPVSTTTSLAEQPPFYDIRQQTQPNLESIQRLKRLRQAGDDVTFELVTCRGPQGQAFEAIQASLETPLPGRRYYLTELQPTP